MNVICDHCGRSYPQEKLSNHIKRYHPLQAGDAKGRENSSSAPAPKVVRFVSPRSPSLTVVIKPTRRGFVNTPQGSMDTVFPGLSIQFREGVFETDDPEIIQYLSEEYKDRRFPVVNMAKASA